MVVYGFNQKYFTADNVLKFIGQAVDDIEYADDYVASPTVEDNKRYSYSGNAEMVEIKSANGEVSVWVVAVMFTKDYVNRSFDVTTDERPSVVDRTKTKETLRHER